jgi:hypothetical protein
MSNALSARGRQAPFAPWTAFVAVEQSFVPCGSEPSSADIDVLLVMAMEHPLAERSRPVGQVVDDAVEPCLGSA